MSKLATSPSGSLQPILPQNTGRYGVNKKVQRKSTTIGPGMFLSSHYASPTFLPPQWKAFVHPEGNIYFHRNSGLSVVTESYMYDPLVAQQICTWAGIAEKEAMAKDLFLTNSVELFLKLDGVDCRYYFVDRVTKAPFWLEQIDTNELGLNETTSTSHLKTLLEAQFWTHTENCCMHFGGLPQKDIDDLILVFSYAFTDTSTSSSSTFPFEAAQCEKFLNLLRASRDELNEGYTVCYVARLWSVIVNVRFENYYGQEQARLDRETAIRVDECQEPKWVQSLVSHITLRTSVPYATRLNKLFADEVVYGWDWNSFMASTVKNWRITAAKSAVLLSLQIPSFILPVFPPLRCASTSCAVLSIWVSSLLIYKHQPLTNGSAGANGGYNYLSTVRSRRVKFQGVAFVYALPETFFLVGLLASLSQGVHILSHYVSLEFLLLSVSVLAFVLLITHYATSDIQIQASALLSIFEQTKDEVSMV